MIRGTIVGLIAWKQAEMAGWPGKAERPQALPGQGMIEPDKANVYLKLLVLKTTQVERLVAFYQTLGIAFAQEQHGKGPIHHSGQIGGVVLEIYPLADDTSTADRTTRLELPDWVSP
jgi:hypothetical protein